MSQAVHSSELQEKTQRLMDGPLKHIRGAALAAALLPLASVAVAPASAQTSCGSAGTVCGFVFNDTNHNGIQDAGETAIEGVTVTLVTSTDTLTTTTGPDGIYYFFVPDGTYPIAATIPVGKQTSPANVGTDDTVDSDGVDNTFGFSTTTVTVVNGGSGTNTTTDFGFFPKSVLNPGTGTPGYWKNHPSAWPVESIPIGGIVYSKALAISWLGRVSGDKTTTMFSALVAAKLSVLIGNDDGCIASTIALADAWMATNGPVGSLLSASSPAWAVGQPLQSQLDAYNNGLLCAPHRQ
jgi:hypothetical protein